MCGICVPHCPTFSLTHNEADGPRGRVSLALGLASGKLLPDPAVVTHLDGCLTCRACESVCPSLVQYGALIDDVREALATRAFPTIDETQAVLPNAASKKWRWLRNHLLSNRKVFGRIWSMLTLLDHLKLVWLIRRFGGRMGKTLPPVLARPFHTKSFHPKRFQPGNKTMTSVKSGNDTKAVGLFIGCTGESLNGNAVRASIRILNALGYAVDIPDAQVCCGAMHQHGGDTRTAARLRAANRAAFAGRNLSAIVVIGTACAGELLRDSGTPPIMELTDFLTQVPDDQWPALQPNPARVAVHLPCSQTRVLKQPHSTSHILSKVPDLKISLLSTNDRCCGAAGLHVLMYPEQADALRAPKLDEIEHMQPDYVVSANIGCATHIATGLGAAVLHPVELILPLSGRAGIVSS